MESVTDESHHGSMPANNALAVALVGLPVLVRRSVIAMWDCLAWVLAVGVLLAVRYDFALSDEQWTWVLLYLTAALVLQMVIGFFLHVYREHVLCILT